tara:strand:- start:738 stop:1007 length:270 start_codon:yes stop_codon:yes gene_type:complete
MKENNQLHMELLKARESYQASHGGSQSREQELEQALHNVEMLSQQKDNKIKQLESQANEMRFKLNQALSQSQHQSSSEIQRIFSGEGKG